MGKLSVLDLGFLDLGFAKSMFCLVLYKTSNYGSAEYFSLHKSLSLSFYKSANRAYVLMIPGYYEGVFADLFQLIPSDIIKEISEGSAYLILDYSHENGSAIMVKSLESTLAEQNILPPRKIVLVLQNRLISSADCLINIFHFDSFPILFVTQMRASFSGAHFDDILPKTNGFRNRLLCMNATPRRHRVLTLLLLREAGLVDFGSNAKFEWGSFSYPGISYEKNTGDSESKLIEWLRLNGYERLIDSYMDLEEKSPHTLDVTTDVGNALAHTIPLDLYQNTDLSVVNETALDPYSLRITEKSIKAVCVGHPFVIVGHKHSVHLVRGLGFIAFDHIIDQSYDVVDDQWTRHELAVKSVAAFIKNLAPSVQSSARESGRYNFNWAMHGFIEFYYHSRMPDLLAVMHVT